ncbi:MAG: rhodanese-like domain-containing protein [Epsilonproteobacteria bacterium]|nr:MAG: rhodanese-like domain-containing protein [Campylobacterota bacterium]
MKKTLFILLILATSLFAELKNELATKDFLKKDIKVIDIRTPSEWKETGIIKDSYTIMFFDEKGAYDVEKFLKELNKIIKKDEQFALICRTGSRTQIISDFLANKIGYRVINLQGGLMKLMSEGYKPVQYIIK